MRTKALSRAAAAVISAALAVPAFIPAVIQANPASEIMYRLYNPNSGEHFYTRNEQEKINLVRIGWNDEGTGWIAPVKSSEPVYRMYNPNAGDHHYTLSVKERDYLVKVGWNYEGIGWYSDEGKSVPLYRQYNPNAIAGAHNFTTNKEENDYLAKIGWHAEGIAWYGVKNLTPVQPEQKDVRVIYYLNDGSPAAWRIDRQKTTI